MCVVRNSKKAAGGGGGGGGVVPHHVIGSIHTGCFVDDRAEGTLSLGLRPSSWLREDLARAGEGCLCSLWETDRQFFAPELRIRYCYVFF